MKKFVEVWIDGNNSSEMINQKCFEKIETLIQEIENNHPNNLFIQLLIYPIDGPSFFKGGLYPRIFLIFETPEKDFKTFYDLRNRE